jgi:hypothetical protein
MQYLFVRVDVSCKDSQNQPETGNNQAALLIVLKNHIVLGKKIIVKQ